MELTGSASGLDVRPETMRRNKNDIKDFDEPIC